MLSSHKFFQKVKSVEFDKCWEWIGSLNKNGYGQIQIDKKLYLAHRISFLLHHKRKPTNQVLHTCDNPCCVNPRHLFEGTQGDNNRDMAKKKRAARLNGTKNPNAKLTIQELKLIEHWFLIGMSRASVANYFKISWTHANTLKIKIDKHLKLS